MLDKIIAAQDDTAAAIMVMDLQLFSDDGQGEGVGTGDGAGDAGNNSGGEGGGEGSAGGDGGNAGTNGNGDGNGGDGQGNNKPAETPPGAPEQYADFTLPEGFDAPTDDFKAWAKEQNMTQEKAQATIDFYTQKIIPQQQAAHAKQVEAWGKESQTKYGKEGIEAANKALGRFSTPEFTELLSQSGLGNHPEMIGIFKQISEKISESGWVDGKQATTGQKPWEKAYSTMD
jgi:hypothetical protein